MRSYVWLLLFSFVFFFKQKTAYEMRISDWSSDVCSSDLYQPRLIRPDMNVGHALPCRLRNDTVDQADGRRVVSAVQQIVGRRQVGRQQEIGRASCRERVCQYV